MAAARQILLLLIVLLVVSVCAVQAVELTGDLPSPTCARIECPSYDVVEKGDGFEIRRYNSAAWTSTDAIDDISLIAATRDGFLRLFDYIQGKNEYGAAIEMTAPVITQVSASDGPFCASSFVVSFYIPKKNQDNPPPSQGLHVQRWEQLRYVAVRQFGGFVRDEDVAKEAAALYSALLPLLNYNYSQGWSLDSTEDYIVAQYNSPFDYAGRVNEIWFFLEHHHPLQLPRRSIDNIFKSSRKAGKSH